eukprot:8152211-Pyramimonas_sp.AAC.1
MLKKFSRPAELKGGRVVRCPRLAAARAAGERDRSRRRVAAGLPEGVGAAGGVDGRGLRGGPHRFGPRHHAVRPGGVVPLDPRADGQRLAAQRRHPAPRGNAPLVPQPGAQTVTTNRPSRVESNHHGFEV